MATARLCDAKGCREFATSTIRFTVDRKGEREIDLCGEHGEPVLAMLAHGRQPEGKRRHRAYEPVQYQDRE